MARLLYREPVTEQPVPSTVILHKDEEFRGYWVKVPALPGCVSHCKSKEEALKNTKEAIALQLECIKKRMVRKSQRKRHIRLQLKLVRLFLRPFLGRDKFIIRRHPKPPALWTPSQ